MTIDFLIGAIRASRDLHPQVKTELEEILWNVDDRKEERKTRNVDERKKERKTRNMDIRLEVCRNGLTFRSIAREMNISYEWLSRVMCGEITPEMRERITTAIDALKEVKQ